MGVEPTAARAVRPAADFEDREAHRDSYTPTLTIAQVGVCRHNFGNAAHHLNGALGAYNHTSLNATELRSCR